MNTEKNHQMIKTNTFHITFYSIVFFALTVFLNPGFTQSVKNIKKPPNILFIAVDDLKPTLGCYGDTVVKTPNIDALANSGITFMRNYCQQAVCAPSRASLLTGQYPDQIKIWDLQTVIRDLNPGIVTLPQYFKNNGYETAATGKIFDPRSLDGSWGGPHDVPSWSIDYTYPGDFYNSEYGSPEYYYASKHALDTISKLKNEARSKGYTTYNEIRNYVKECYWPPVENAKVPYDAYIDGALANHGISLMETLASGDKPFFLAVGFNRPHLPFNAPEEYWNIYNRDNLHTAAFQERAENSPDLAYHNSGELRNGYTGVPEGIFTVNYQKELIHGYYAATSYIDAMVGKLLQKLDDLGLSNNTIVVLWGDHGWHLGDHSLWCKHSNFENAVKAPLIMKSPFQLTKGGQHFGPTEFTDIAPTLCSLAGLKIPVYFEGENLTSLFNDPGLNLRTTAFSQYPREGKKYMGYSVRTKRYRYTKWIQTSTGEMHASELYDYEVDSLETKSFINDPGYTSVINSLDSIVNQRMDIPSTQPKIHYRVKAKDENGNISPLPNSTIHIDGFEIASNDTGYAIITHPIGTYQVEAGKKGYSLVTKTIHLQNDTLICDTLKPKINQVGIKVIDAESYGIVDSCEVWINDQKLISSVDSIYQYPNLISGNYLLSIKKEHYVSIDDKEIFVFSDSVFEIQLKKKQYLVEFIITDDYTKNKISGVEILIGDIQETTDFNGFTNFLIPFNNYKITFQKDQYQSQAQHSIISSDTSYSINLHKTSGNVTFKIRDGTTPVNKALIILDNDSLITNNLGMAEFKSLDFNQNIRYTFSKNGYKSFQDQFIFVYDTTLNLQVAKSTYFQSPSLKISVYPNPFTNEFFISSIKQIHAIQICDVYGRIIQRIDKPDREFRVDVSLLSNGMYFMTVIFDDMGAFNTRLYKTGT